MRTVEAKQLKGIYRDYLILVFEECKGMVIFVIFFCSRMNLTTHANISMSRIVHCAGYFQCKI